MAKQERFAFANDSGVHEASHPARKFRPGSSRTIRRNGPDREVTGIKRVTAPIVTLTQLEEGKTMNDKWYDEVVGNSVSEDTEPPTVEELVSEIAYQDGAGREAREAMIRQREWNLKFGAL